MTSFKMSFSLLGAVSLSLYNTKNRTVVENTRNLS